jgi:hypothetical protein
VRGIEILGSSHVRSSRKFAGTEFYEVAARIH